MKIRDKRYSKDFISAKTEAGARREQLVEALGYKPEGRGFESWWCVIEIFH